MKTDSDRRREDLLLQDLVQLVNERDDMIHELDLHEQALAEELTLEQNAAKALSAGRERADNSNKRMAASDTNFHAARRSVWNTLNPHEQYFPDLLRLERALLRSRKASSAASPDGLPPALLKFGAASLTNMMTSIVNESLSSRSIPHPWLPVTIIPIAKSTSSAILAKRFPPIALISAALKLTSSFSIVVTRPYVEQDLTWVKELPIHGPSHISHSSTQLASTEQNFASDPESVIVKRLRVTAHRVDLLALTYPFTG
ncbi:unnamed protein product [Echinostoma caproni]|uniref:BMERB domain-containing protein n=1 Tax=Echinostoma caproni TaxID=27848 RepID=A0A183AP34_9TREM|nr:unnamed protein product [Echinostoma caproni]